MKNLMCLARTRRVAALRLTLLSVLAVAAAVMLTTVRASAQCPVTELTSGLQLPLGITQTNQGNLLVSESGTPVPNTGRISIVDLDGNRTTLLAGLPSGINDVNEPSGPAGLFMRGRTLYVAIGIGDSVLAGPFPGTALPNPNPSSPIFSSVLAIHFSDNVEKTTAGFTLTFANQQALASGEEVTLRNVAGDKIMAELVANLPGYTPNPFPFFADNVRGVNPFALVVVDDQVYITDGAQNSLWQVDIPTSAFSTLAAFPDIPNPLFPGLGGPFIEAVPTGLRYSDGQLLVTLFKGFPFLGGTSEVRAVDPETGAQALLSTGLTTAIDVLPLREGGGTHYFVLEHATEFSLPPFTSPSGVLLRFDTAGGPPTIIAECLNRPTSMTLDAKTGTLYATELGGRIVAIAVAP
jgi:hypothetical protein